MSSRTWHLPETVHSWLLTSAVHEPEVAARLRRETSELTMARMQISPEQGALLGLLTELVGARRALEIGTFTGYSTLCMALALPDDGEMVACDVSEEWTNIGRRYWEEAGVGERVTLHLGPACDTLERLRASGGDDSFDLAFIDADKEGYPDYYEACVHLVRPGGLIAVDNTLWGGAVADPADVRESTKAIRETVAQVHADQRTTSALVPIGDGLLLARVR